MSINIELTLHTHMHTYTHVYTAAWNGKHDIRDDCIKRADDIGVFDDSHPSFGRSMRQVEKTALRNVE
jgi:hypothetical protein